MLQRQQKKEQIKNKYEPSFQPNIDPHVSLLIFQSAFINDVENLGDLFNRMKTKEEEAEKKKNDIVKKK